MWAGSRLSKGFRGVWDRLTGKYAKITWQNEREALQAFYRERQEIAALIYKQMEQREGAQQRIREERKDYAQELLHIRHDIAKYQDMRSSNAPILSAILPPNFRNSDRRNRPLLALLMRQTSVSVRIQPHNIKLWPYAMRQKQASARQERPG